MSHIYIIDPMGFPGPKNPEKNMAHLGTWDKAFQRKLISPTKTVRFSCFCVSEMVLALSMLHCFVSRCFCRYYIPGWWFPTCFIFTPIWGRIPFWLIFFRWVETTNQIPISFFSIVILVGKIGGKIPCLTSSRLPFFDSMADVPPTKIPGVFGVFYVVDVSIPQTFHFANPRKAL